MRKGMLRFPRKITKYLLKKNSSIALNQESCTTFFPGVMVKRLRNICHGGCY